MQTILVTGGAGFIGSAVVRRLVGQGKRVVNLDKLTYAGNVESLNSIAAAANHRLVVGDVCDAELLLHLMRDEQVDAIMHLAAESHVDRSIDGPAVFVETNVVGTFRLLEAALEYWKGLDDPKRIPSAFITYRRTKFSVICHLTVLSLLRGHLMPHRHPIPRPKPQVTISSAPGITPTACRWCFRIVRTLTAPINFPRN